MFKIGDMAVYPAQGVGVIEAIEAREYAGVKNEFYVLRIVDSDMTIMVPIANAGQVGMRTVGAAARAMLVGAAARRWNVPAERLTVRDGIVSDPASGRSARFGELASEAAQLSVPSSPRLKQPPEWRIIGTSPPRFDIPAKTDGSFGYGIDLDLPDMVHAAVAVAPVHGGRLVNVDPEPARSMPYSTLRSERKIARYGWIRVKLLPGSVIVMIGHT